MNVSLDSFVEGQHYEIGHMAPLILIDEILVVLATELKEYFCYCAIALGSTVP